jgi:hypothetical protein
VVDHQQAGLPLARFPATIRLEHRDDGLHWSFEPPESRADVIEAIERGDLAGSSWSMQVSRDEYRGDTRHVLEIGALTDVTLVGSQTPAYETQVEYRSAPRVTNEPERTEQVEDNKEETKGQPERRGPQGRVPRGRQRRAARCHSRTRGPHLSSACPDLCSPLPCSGAPKATSRSGYQAFHSRCPRNRGNSTLRCVPALPFARTAGASRGGRDSRRWPSQPPARCARPPPGADRRRRCRVV